ncbi:hypothetical protein BCR36DRAFT_286130, partial [Piromyces finnis]
EFFVDKTEFILDLNKKFNNNICILKPKRFGKSAIVNMLSAYYDHNESKITSFTGKKNFLKLKIGINI